MAMINFQEAAAGHPLIFYAEDPPCNHRPLVWFTAEYEPIPLSDEQYTLIRLRSTITAHRDVGNAPSELNFGFPGLRLILEVPEPANIRNAATGMNSRAHLLYGVGPYGGTVKSTEFEWDEMNDPLLSWCLHHDFLEVS